MTPVVGRPCAAARCGEPGRFILMGDHRRHHPHLRVGEVAAHGDRAELGVEDLRVGAQRPHSPDPQRRVRLTGVGQPRQRFVRAGVEDAHGHPVPRKGLKDFGVGVAKLGAHQADAFGARGEGGRDVLRRADVGLQQHPMPIRCPARPGARGLIRCRANMFAEQDQPARRVHGHQLTVVEVTASAQPITAGMPMLRARIALWLVGPPSIVISASTLSSRTATSAGARSRATST